MDNQIVITENSDVSIVDEYNGVDVLVLAGENTLAAATSASGAATSATNAAASATAAANSATAANTSKNAAATSATDAAASASAANTSKNAAASSATAAGTSATNAGNSATAAAGSASAASTSATNAAGSATAASTSKNAAASSAADAATLASAAYASQTAAAGSAADALVSKNAAATSATNAAGSATTADSFATAAGNSATDAATSATAAATSATNAGNSATAAAGSASAASTSATNAGTSASTATTQAGAAAASATAAGVNADRAQAAVGYHVSIAYASYAELSAVVGSAGQSAAVFGDAGSHTDPVTGGTKSNTGIYSYSASPAGWKWLSANLGTIYIDGVIGLQAALDGKAAFSHSQDASTIDSGTFDVARIPNLDAAKIASGQFDLARIPVLPSQIQVVSSGAIAALTPPQQTTIGPGTVVTTTDGRRWVYSGTGSKTLEASYVVLADITPEWDAVANKPAFGTAALANTVDLVPKNNGEQTGTIYHNGSQRAGMNTAGGTTIDCSLTNYFQRSISANTTFSFTNPPASGTAFGFTLELDYTAGTLVFPAAVNWGDLTAPTMAAGKWIFMFITRDGGTSWTGRYFKRFA